MNDSKKCGMCLWRDDCEFETPCDYYSDERDDLTDEQIAQYIEERRQEFYREWTRYISQYE